MEKNKAGTGRPGWQAEEGSRTWCPRTGQALPLSPVRQEVAQYDTSEQYLSVKNLDWEVGLGIEAGDQLRDNCKNETRQD